MRASLVAAGAALLLAGLPLRAQTPEQRPRASRTPRTIR